MTDYQTVVFSHTFHDVREHRPDAYLDSFTQFMGTAFPLLMVLVIIMSWVVLHAELNPEKQHPRPVDTPYAIAVTILTTIIAFSLIIFSQDSYLDAQQRVDTTQAKIVMKDPLEKLYWSTVNYLDAEDVEASFDV